MGQMDNANNPMGLGGSGNYGNMGIAGVPPIGGNTGMMGNNN